MKAFLVLDNGEIFEGESFGYEGSEVLDVMKELAKAGMTMVVVTHEVNFVSSAATRVWEMRNGKIVKDHGQSN
jgi:ABC-type polar amino acid transport system ATPase subunit